MFVKGKSGNPAGKKKGTLAKKTIEALNRIDKVLNALDETILDDLKAMRPAERAALFKDLLEYRNPKLARTELTGEGGEAIKIVSVGVNLEKI